MNNIDPKYVSLRLLKCGGDIESAIATLKEFTSWQQDIEFLDKLKDKIDMSIDNVEEKASEYASNIDIIQNELNESDELQIKCR